MNIVDNLDVEARVYVLTVICGLILLLTRLLINNSKIKIMNIEKIINNQKKYSKDAMMKAIKNELETHHITFIIRRD